MCLDSCQIYSGTNMYENFHKISFMKKCTGPTAPSAPAHTALACFDVQVGPPLPIFLPWVALHVSLEPITVPFKE